MKIVYVINWFLSLLAVVYCVQNKHLVEKCCSLGGSLGVDGRDCKRVQFPIPGIESADQSTCKSIAEFCCDRERLHLECKLGEIFAKTYGHCVMMDKHNSTQTCANQAESCCLACMLAQTLKSAQMDCRVPGLEDSNLSHIFQRCCSESPASDRQDPEDLQDPNQNLCQVLPGQLCAQICIPTVNSFYCKCDEGFVLMEDQKSCQRDQSERSKSKSALSLTPILIPNPERPVPLKKITPFPPPPVNKDKCSEGSGCQHICTDSRYGQVCSCRPGHELHPDGFACLDIDECLDNLHVCDPSLEICQNEIGSYRCEPRPGGDASAISSTAATTSTTTAVAVETMERKQCLDGYQLVDNDCIDVDECRRANVCQIHEQCVNSQGSFECRCAAGFNKEVKNGPCVDINECQTNTHECKAEQRCDNTVGSYFCHRIAGCGTGYTLNVNSGQCEDDDECSLGTDNCRFLGKNGVQFQCSNTQGSFRCEPIRCPAGGDVTQNCSAVSLCQRGYREHPITRACVDINECDTHAHRCDPLTETCFNRRGGYDCRKNVKCSPGYTWSPSLRGCADVDECQTGAQLCGAAADCRNQPGSYTCHCHAGYHKTHASQVCSDVDECARYACPPTANCQNLPGSYRCLCKVGYLQDGPNHCIDENECETQGACDHHCINIFGSYRCSCRNGFYLSEDNRTCSDIDECARFADQRLCIGICANNPGSFECKCPSGYTLGGDGRTCHDVDECLHNPCRGADEVCLNIGGSYACNSIACPSGYIKDGVQKNRCKMAPCHDSHELCRQKPATISYNFITFVSMLHIPSSGYLDLFALRGPPLAEMGAHFELALLSADAPPGETLATLQYFQLRTPGWGQAVVALTRPIPGPQRIQLELTANIHHNGIFTGKAVAKLNIHVSQYQF